MRKKLLILLLVLLCISFTTACGKKESSDNNSSSIINRTPLKSDYDEAEYQIKVAVQEKFEDMYDGIVVDARIYVKKVYTAEEEKNIPVLKDMNLGNDDVAFEIEYELKPAEGVDINVLTVSNGEYDESTGWVKNKFNVGVLKATDKGYVITNFGTGF